MATEGVTCKVALELDEGWAGNLTDEELVDNLTTRLNNGLGFRGKVKKLKVVWNGRKQPQVMLQAESMLSKRSTKQVFDILLPESSMAAGTDSAWVQQAHVPPTPERVGVHIQQLTRFSDREEGFRAVDARLNVTRAFLRLAHS